MSVLSLSQAQSFSLAKGRIGGHEPFDPPTPDAASVQSRRSPLK